MKKNKGKRGVEAGAADQQQKRPYADDEPDLEDDDFVMADFVRNVHPKSWIDSGPSKKQQKWARVSDDEDDGADSGVEADVVPKVC